jgi:hypothetical protein
MKHGNLRASEQWLTEFAARNSRWASFAPTAKAAETEVALNKYHNVKTDGYSSKREAKRAEELKLLVLSGNITQLREQPKYLLIPKQEGERACHYIADFEYKTNVGARVVEDVKGVRTPVYLLKRKLLLFVHGIRVTEVA